MRAPCPDSDALRIERALELAHEARSRRGRRGARLRAAFSRPMPCSALMLPPRLSDQIEHRDARGGPALEECLSVGSRRLAHVEMQIAVARMAVGDRRRRPAARRRTSAEPPRSAPGIAETGTERSCLRLAPWRRCASGIDSRNFHMACACASEVAMHRVSRSGSACGASSRTSANDAANPARIRRGEFDEQYQGASSAQRIGDAFGRMSP